MPDPRVVIPKGLIFSSRADPGINEHGFEILDFETPNMIVATKRTEDVTRRQSLLIEQNITWLRQAGELLEQISDSAYAASPSSISPHRIGGHLRHILEFYECFLHGLESCHIDYDARKRDPAVERNRHAAMAKIDSILHVLQTDRMLLADWIIWVRMEDAEAFGVKESFMISSTGRELQMLSSHTIHHFALIAMALRVLGYEVDRDFGMAPSTLRYLSSQQRAGEPAEAA
jgi:hypothetical protein